MERIRSILRALCIVGAVWSALCCGPALFLLSGAPLVQNASLEAAGLVFRADIAYIATGALLLASGAFSFAVCLFGLRCTRLVKHMDVLRMLSLAGFSLFVACIVACLVIGKMHGIGWAAVIGAALLFSAASLSGEMSRALIASHMLRGER